MSQHLQKTERIQIQTLLDTGKGIDDIAIYLNRHRSTIYREMKRAGVDAKNYEAYIYHKSARKNMGRKVERAPSSNTILLIEQQILNEQWSPEQISNWLKIHNYETVSHTWIYKYIKGFGCYSLEIFDFSLYKAL